MTQESPNVIPKLQNKKLIWLIIRSRFILHKITFDVNGVCFPSLLQLKSEILTCSWVSSVWRWAETSLVWNCETSWNHWWTGCCEMVQPGEQKKQVPSAVKWQVQVIKYWVFAVQYNGYKIKNFYLYFKKMSLEINI